MLAVLRGADLGDVTVVVTRYFGGTLLGTGGLVRAYSDAVRAVLAILPRTERIELCQLRIDVSYAAYATARRILEAHQAVILQETFAELVQIDAQLACEVRDTVCAQLIDQSAGQAHIAML
jgi:putative IMPACT (imprinted ancient) family translation regulator